jgi:hypothetical protein
MRTASRPTFVGFVPPDAAKPVGDGLNLLHADVQGSSASTTSFAAPPRDEGPASAACCFETMVKSMSDMPSIDWPQTGFGLKVLLAERAGLRASSPVLR